MIQHQRTLSNLAKVLLSETAQKLIQYQRRTTVIEPQLKKSDAKAQLSSDSDFTDLDSPSEGSRQAMAKMIHKPADLDETTIRLQKGVFLINGVVG